MLTLTIPKLENIYQSIKSEHGVEAADQFAQMVADIPKLSATDFLLSLYRLEAHKWQWSNELLGREKGIYVDGETQQAKMGSAVATIFAALAGDSERDDTRMIREPFLARHGLEDPRRKGRDVYEPGYDF